ncbi:MAG: efflux RND transporter periplasmic adaptor subunit [Candidatus Delongbacteria bacterium]
MARTRVAGAARRTTLALLTAGTLVLIGCGGNGKAAQDEKGSKDVLEGTTQQDKVNVVVEALVPRSFSSRLLLVGEVLAENDAILSSQVSGTLRRVVADRGARVQAGDTLLVLDSRRYQAAFDAAQAQAGNARLDFENADRLFKAGQSVSESDWKKAQNGLRMAEAGLANARIDLENCFLTAPKAGIVAERLVDVGELVNPGSPLLQVVQGELKVRCGVPENQVARAEKGAAATVRVSEAGIESPARIQWVGAVLEARSRTLPVELKLEKSAALRPGMACTVEIRRGRDAASLVVPVTVVQRQGDQDVVFVEEGGLAVVRVLSLGERDGDQVEVLGGLKAGERLIVSGYRGLVPGQALAVVDSPAAVQMSEQAKR